MAVTGIFQADFKNFLAAIEQADLKLADLDKGAGRVEGALNRMVDSFSGRKVIQDATLMFTAVEAIGGVSKLTATELERLTAKVAEASAKLNAMGIDVPPGFQRILASAKPLPEHLSLADRAANALTGTLGQLVAGFTLSNLIDRGASALIGFAKGAIDSAGALVDLSGKTGIGVEALQRFQIAGAQSGVTVENFADAAFKLGVKISGGSGSVKQALTELGISFDSIRNLKPEDQFTIISAALEGMSNEQDRNRIGVELFGKSFSTIAPAIADGYSKIAAAATVASEAQIKAIDAASDRWSAFVANTKNTVTSVIGSYLLAADAIGPFKLALAAVTGTLPSLLPALAKTGEEMNAVADGLKRLGDVNTFVGPTLAAPLQSFVSALADVKKEFSSLTIEQKQNVLAGLELGQTIDQISLKTGVSIEAVRLVKEENHANAAAMKEWAASNTQVETTLERLHVASLKIFKDIAAERDRQKNVVNAAVLAEFEAQQELNRIYRVDTPSALKEYQRALDDLHRVKAEGISQSAQEQILIDKFTKSLLDEAVAQDKANASVAEGNQVAAQAPVALGAATAAVYQFQGSLVATNAELQRFHAQFANEVGNLSKFSVGTPANLGAGTRFVPGFAGGVQNFAGGMAIVGERGPELLNLPRGSSVIPLTSGGGVTVNVLVQGSVLSSKTELARAIESALTTLYASRGLRYPTGV